MSSEVTGPATRARITLAGTSSMTVQVSSADEIWLVARAASGSAPDRSAGPASTGTMMLASAPPSTMS
jgi:hypothetical protein